MADLAQFDLTGRTALITGGTTGIGWTCAVALAKCGANVAVVGRREDVGGAAVLGLRKLGCDSLYVRCDVSRSEQVEAMVAAVVRRFGRLDIAVNNAGIFRAGVDESQPKHDWDEVIATNLTGTWLCARAEMKQMIEQAPVAGKIINVASIAATIACSNGAYDASKAAIVHLTRTLAARWGRYNINVNCISPSYVLDNKRPADQCAQIIAATPLGYVQWPADLQGPVVFLASAASDFMTGQNLLVDGGHTLSSWLAPLRRTEPTRREVTCD